MAGGIHRYLNGAFFIVSFQMIQLIIEIVININAVPRNIFLIVLS